jgi:hypothetical protein
MRTRLIDRWIAGVLASLLLGCHESNSAANNDSKSAYLALTEIGEWECFTNDRDNNGVKDFWTGDVVGLYRLGLVSRQIAEADALPINPLVDHPVPYHGYLFVALEWDDSGSVPEQLKQDTDGKAGKVHHKQSFGFCAFPVASKEKSPWTYLRGHGGGMNVTLGRMNQEKAEPVLRWPNPAQISSSWLIVD